jgi:ABC-type phosphate transport system auxiliary subunit
MKNTNLDLNHHLKDEELKTSDATNKLGLASANLKSQEIDYDSLNHNLRQKIQRFDTISREKAIAITDLNTVNIELERLNRDELQFNHENIDFEANVARL